MNRIPYGNQHESNKGTLMHQLHVARNDLRRASLAPRESPMRAHYVALAEAALQLWRYGYNATPAGTRRRWKCGK